MKRIFHHYQNWEDFQSGMWRTVSGNERIEFLRKAIEFTGDAKLYGSFMQRVIAEWPFACEHNLTDTSQNRKAWIGHAATCLGIDCPEDVTRLAWAQLTQQQQDEANEQAQQAIEKWEEQHAAKNIAVHSQVGEAGIQGWNTGLSAESLRSYWQMSLLPQDMHGDIEK